MQKAKQTKSKSAAKEGFPFSIQHASQASLERLRDRSGDEGLEFTDTEDLEGLGDDLDPTDRHFKSELDYEGYRSIEESDNNAYNSLELERVGDADTELEIEDRADSLETGEESPLDPQENTK